MYANVRETIYEPAKLDQGQDRIAEFQTLRARQPGFRGTIVVDAGDGRWLTVKHWQTTEHAAAALPALIPRVQRVLEQMLSEPSQLVGAGPVVMSAKRSHSLISPESTSGAQPATSAAKAC